MQIYGKIWFVSIMWPKSATRPTFQIHTPSHNHSLTKQSLRAIYYFRQFHMLFTLTKFQKPQEVDIISPFAGQPLISSNNIASKWWIEVSLQNVLGFFLNHYGKLPPRVFKFLNQCASFQCKCHTLLRSYPSDIFRPLKPLSLSKAKEISQEEHAWKHVQLDI